MNALIQARNWSVATAGGGAVLLLFLLLLHLPLELTSGWNDLPPLARGPALQVSWSGNQPEASDRQSAQLMDPTPLFMPTPRSAANKHLIENSLADKFPALAPSTALKFRPSDLKLDNLPAPVTMPAGPAEALAANPPGNLAMGFGRTDQAASLLPPRQAWVEITTPANGKVVLRSALPPGAVPDLPGSNWEPLAFFANVSAAGLVGSIILMPAPSAEGGFLTLDADVAEQLAKYLEVRMDLGQRLTPGFYRISVGP